MTRWFSAGKKCLLILTKKVTEKLLHGYKTVQVVHPKASVVLATNLVVPVGFETVAKSFEVPTTL